MSSNRPIKRLVLFAVVVLFALTFHTLEAQTQKMVPKTVTVTIKPGHPITVSPDPAVVSKSEGDQIEWVCAACTSGFSVHFPKGSPFASGIFNQKNPKSGKARPGAAEGLYHYTVTANGHTLDPGVKVNP